MEDPKRILIVRLSSLGDVIHTLPIAAALRRRFPEAKICWAVHPAFAPMIPSPPWIDEIIEVPRPSLGHPIRLIREIAALRRRLRAEGFDMVIDLQGLMKSAAVALLSGARQKIGTSFMREGSYLVCRPVRGPHAGNFDGGHVIEQALDVARFLGAQQTDLLFPLPQQTDAWEKVRERFDLKRPYALLVPGTRCETKCWPPEHYAELSAALRTEGLDIVLLGSRGDLPRSEEILRLAGRQGTEEMPARMIDTTGRTNLLEMTALVQHASLFVSGDTGPLHIAFAAKRPIVALFGPTRPQRSGPYGYSGAVNHQTPLPCRNCFKRKCSHWECMKAITPQQVLEKCREVLASAADAAAADQS
ncbi:MAG: lipopolysaccharide heptosyltransferase II [Thermoguttaceae bacterium]|nr:lipopolysaccharide heptosyltransferase II [Thermoguttaceae bacterium]